MSEAINPVSVMATAANRQQNKGEGTWFQAMAEAWGKTLDKQAGKLEELAADISTNGADTPSTLTLMSAESLKMGFLSNASHTALTSTGEALKTMAQKS
jgi:hypothetical protein